MEVAVSLYFIFYLKLFLAVPHVLQDFGSRPGMGPTPPVVEVRCLNQQTAREVPVSLCFTDVEAEAQRLRELTKVTQLWAWLRIQTRSTEPLRFCPPHRTAQP